MQIKCTINNKEFTQIIEPDLLLIDFIRDLGFFSVKRGCDTTNCGLCTVWVEKRSVLSCAVLAASVDGKEITTLEGLEKEVKEFARFMAFEGAEQCGFCSPGLIMNILVMQRELENPSMEDIKKYLAGNLCRCSGYTGQMRAIKKYLDMKKDKKAHEIC